MRARPASSSLVISRVGCVCGTGLGPSYRAEGKSRRERRASAFAEECQLQEIETMGKNLRNRIVFIVVVLALPVYGIIGIPHGGLKQALTDRIHLGLDLRGGTHLVLQVKVAEAVSHETD